MEFVSARLISLAVETTALDKICYKTGHENSKTSDIKGDNKYMKKSSY